jgi:hypothetical protein
MSSPSKHFFGILLDPGIHPVNEATFVPVLESLNSALETLNF